MSNNVCINTYQLLVIWLKGKSPCNVIKKKPVMITIANHDVSQVDFIFISRKFRSFQIFFKIRYNRQLYLLYNAHWFSAVYIAGEMTFLISIALI
jgi:hypothetical protein